MQWLETYREVLQALLDNLLCVLRGLLASAEAVTTVSIKYQACSERR